MLLVGNNLVERKNSLSVLGLQSHHMMAFVPEFVWIAGDVVVHQVFEWLESDVLSDPVEGVHQNTAFVCESIRRTKVFKEQATCRRGAKNQQSYQKFGHFSVFFQYFSVDSAIANPSKLNGKIFRLFYHFGFHSMESIATVAIWLQIRIWSIHRWFIGNETMWLVNLIGFWLRIEFCVFSLHWMHLLCQQGLKREKVTNTEKSFEQLCLEMRI